MNDVGGSDSGTGLRAGKSSRTSDASFEYDDSEWDIGIGNLIIDLDADIEKNNEANKSSSSGSAGAVPSNHNLASPDSNTLTSTACGSQQRTSNLPSQMHIPRSPSGVTSANNSVTLLKSGNKGSPGSGANPGTLLNSPSGNGGSTKTATSSSSDSTKILASASMEHSAVADKGLKMKIKRSKPGTKSVDAKHEIVKSDVTALNPSSVSGKNSTGTISESKSSSGHSKEKPEKQDSSSSSSSKGDDREGSANSSGDQNAGSKGKTAKRGSTHKKVKSSSGNSTSGSEKSSSSNSASSSNKKDTNSTDSKSASANLQSSSTSGGSQTKESFNNSSNSSSNSGGVTPSAFVKTSAGNSSSITIKTPTTTSSASLSSSQQLSDTIVSASGGTQGSSFRSHHSHTSNSSPSWTTGTISKPDKVQGRLSPSVSAASTPEKLGNANNNPCGKKPRVFISSDKSAIQEETVLLSDGSTSASNSSTPHRTSVTLSSASLSDLNASSCSSSLIHHGVSLQSGATLLSSVNAPKEAKTSRVPPTAKSQDMGTVTHVGTLTEPDCLGPCEPGTSVTLEGIVWHETESGVLVVNVTWRGKTYVGTLLDCTKSDWAPPRFCDSPTSDLEMRNPKNRGKRGRAQTATPVNEAAPGDTRQSNAKLRNGRRGSSSNSGFATPVSPLKPDPWPKRKTRGSENESQEDSPVPTKNSKRPKVSSVPSKESTTSNSKERQSSSPAPITPDIPQSGGGPYSPALIECPEPNCSKKYKHINGLRYHQSHAHSNNFTPEDSDSNMSTASTTMVNSLNLEADRGSAAGKSNDTVDCIPNENDNNQMDVDIEDGETIPSAPSTPAKRSFVPSNEDKIYDVGSDTEITVESGKDGDPEVPAILTPIVTSGNKSGTPKAAKTIVGEKEKADVDKAVEGQQKDSMMPSSVGRTPILTVPVPYLSLQNRSLAHSHGHHGHGGNLGSMNRKDSDKSNPLSREDQLGTKSQSITNLTSGVPTNTAPKGAPWQPHAHTHSHSPHQAHQAHVISSVQSANNPVPLTVPIVNSREHDKSKSIKDKSCSDVLPTKKSKHKKKSKDRDRSKESHKGAVIVASKVNLLSATEKPKDLTDKRSSSTEECDRDSVKGIERDSGAAGENRDDPQSPAYSDISDANDSGTEADTSVTGGVNSAKDNCVKNLVVTNPELAGKKDGPLGIGIPPAHSISSFFPSFYSPYMEQGNSGSGPANGNSQSSKSDGLRPSGPEESGVIDGKNKPKPHSHIPTQSHPGHASHLHQSVPVPPTSSVPAEERRSPKMEYAVGNKYLPQHYFAPHYPYSNYYEQPYGASILGEGSYASNNLARAYADEKERELQMTTESRSKIKIGDKDEPQNLVGNIKQEPGADRLDKDRREKDVRSMSTMSVDHDPHDVKPEFPENAYPSDKRVNLLPPQHFMPCNKHTKDSKRDDRHSSKENDLNKDPISLKSSRSSLESSKNIKSQNSDRDMDSDRDKDGKDKNEGAKPTMETQGPPPPPTAGSYAYLPQSYLPGNPFGLTFDPSHPLYRQVLVPGPYGGSPYMHPGSIPRYPPTPGGTPLPEDLSRPSGSAPPGPASKALDLLQHHAAQYYASHKIHELHERALKSPSPQVSSNQVPGQNLTPTPSSPGTMPERSGRGSIVGGNSGSNNTSSNSAGPISSSKPADLTKDSKPVIGGQPSESRSPPTQHHVHSHTHHHTHHVGLTYPMIPAVPPQYSPHYGVLANPAPASAVAASVITPFPSSQKPT